MSARRHCSRRRARALELHLEMLRCRGSDEFCRSSQLSARSVRGGRCRSAARLRHVGSRRGKRRVRASPAAPRPDRITTAPTVDLKCTSSAFRRTAYCVEGNLLFATSPADTRLPCTALGRHAYRHHLRLPPSAAPLGAELAATTKPRSLAVFAETSPVVSRRDGCCAVGAVLAVHKMTDVASFTTCTSNSSPRSRPGRSFRSRCEHSYPR